MARRIDCHLHIWSDDHERFPFNRERGGEHPPSSLHPTPPRHAPHRSAAHLAGSPNFNIPPGPDGMCGSAEELLKAQADVNVDGAMIVQPVHHGFDHTYITDAMQRYPGKFRSSLVIDPYLSPEDAVAEINRLHALGWNGVRMKPGLWPDGAHPRPLPAPSPPSRSRHPTFAVTAAPPWP